MKDYYAILEVHPKASPEIIKKAYQTLAKKYHPDITKLEIKVAAKKMSNINEAYKILSDPLLRKKYDAQYFNNNQESNDTNNTIKREPTRPPMQAIDEYTNKMKHIISGVYNKLCK